MAKEEKQLEIVARVKDQITRGMRKIGANIKRIIKTAFLAPFKLLGAAIRKVWRATTGLGAALVGAFAIWRGGTFATGVIDTADSLNKLAQQTDTSVESISTLEKAFQFAGLSVEQFRAIITGLGRGTSAAINVPSSIQGDAFAALGISIEELKRGDAVNIFGRIAEGLRQFNTQAEKAAVLQKLFPDNFQKLLPLLDDVENGFRANVKAAEAFGGALSKNLANTASATADELLKIKIALESIAREAVLGLAKELGPALRGLVAFLQVNRGRLVEALATAMRLLAEAIFNLAKAVIWLTNNLPTLRTRLRDVFRTVPLLGEKLETLFDTVTRSDGTMDRFASALTQIATSGEDAAAGLAAMEKQQRVSFSPETRKRLLKDAEERAKLNRMLSEVGSIQDFARFGSADVPISRGAAGASAGLANTTEGVRSLSQAFSDFWQQFGQGAKAGIKAWTEFGVAGKRAGTQLIDSIGNGLTQALTDGITRTKDWADAFRDAARSVLQDIARIISRLIAMQFVQAGLNYAGSFGGSTSGGTATGPGNGSSSISFGSRITGPPEGGGMNVTINAVDAPSVRRLLINERELLNKLQNNAMQSNSATRDIVRGVAR